MLIKIFYILSLMLFILHSGCVSTNESRINKQIPDNRDIRQIYIEDSSKVYWTRYPDPFSPPTYINTFHVSGTNTFSCKLQGEIEIGFLKKDTDSIVCSFPYDSNKLINNEGHFWIFYAKSHADTSKFLPNFYRSTSESPLNLVLIANKRLKSILPVDIVIPQGQYCFINYSNNLKLD